MNKLTLVIPAKKESETLPRVIEQLKSLDCKILVCCRVMTLIQWNQ